MKTLVLLSLLMVVVGVGVHCVFVAATTTHCPVAVRSLWDCMQHNNLTAHQQQQHQQRLQQQHHCSHQQHPQQEQRQPQGERGNHVQVPPPGTDIVWEGSVKVQHAQLFTQRQVCYLQMEDAVSSACLRSLGVPPQVAKHVSKQTHMLSSRSGSDSVSLSVSVSVSVCASCTHIHI